METYYFYANEVFIIAHVRTGSFSDVLYVHIKHQRSCLWVDSPGTFNFVLFMCVSMAPETQGMPSAKGL